MSKILDSILTLKDNPSSDWKPELDRINVYEEVAAIYFQKWSTDFCNRVLAFIVLAYDNRSGWIELHKDRWDNKFKIAQRLGLKTEQKVVKEIIQNQNHTVNDIVAWFVGFQVDWRWDAVLSCFEYASEMMRFAKTKTNEHIVEATEDGGGKQQLQEVDIEKLSRGNLVKGKNLQDAIEQRKKGEELLKELREQFSVLDTVLHKEGYRKATDLQAMESWEAYIKELRGY